MENMFPTLLERDNIKEDVGKWIQFMMNEINKHKTDLTKCDTSSESGKEAAALISKNIKKFESKLTKLDKFYLSISNEKYCKVNYAQKEGLNIGRIYAQGPCIFKLDREIRNSLLAKNYHDIDIENCHPCIVEWLAKKLDLPHKYISDYINRRKHWFEIIKSVHGYDCNQAKTLMLRLLYLGEYYQENKIPFVVKYAKELTGIAIQLWKDVDEKTKKLVKDEVKKKGKGDIKLKDSKATLMSWCIQDIECGILLKIYQWFTDNGYNVGQFCHDGLTIKSNEYNTHPNLFPEDIIEEANNEINEIGGKYNFDGYTVTLSEKLMEIKDLGDIIVDPNILPHLEKKKVWAKITKEKCLVKNKKCASDKSETSLSDAPKIVATKIHFQNHQLIEQLSMVLVIFYTRLLVKRNLQI